MQQRGAVAWVIVVIWSATYVRKIADPAFAVPAEITPVMLTAAGYLFGKDIKDRLVGSKGRRDEDE